MHGHAPLDMGLLDGSRDFGRGADKRSLSVTGNCAVSLPPPEVSDACAGAMLG